MCKKKKKCHDYLTAHVQPSMQRRCGFYCSLEEVLRYWRCGTLVAIKMFATLNPATWLTHYMHMCFRWDSFFVNIKWQFSKHTINVILWSDQRYTECLHHRDCSFLRGNICAWVVFYLPSSPTMWTILSCIAIGASNMYGAHSYWNHPSEFPALLMSPHPIPPSKSCPV